MNSQSEREILIDAPIATVWDVVTRPEQWFSDSATIDLRPGGTGVLHWDKHERDSQVTVVELEHPHFFSFAWKAPDEAEMRAIVEFRLTTEGDKTKLRVVERLETDSWPESAMNDYYSLHNNGWGVFLGKIQSVAQEAVKKA